MENLRFFDKKNYITIQDVIDLTGSRINLDFDKNAKIYNISTLDNATESDISFLNSGQYLNDFIKSKAGFCLLQEKYLNKAPDKMIKIIHDNPYYAYAKIVEIFYKPKKFIFEEKNQINSSAKIGEGTKIANNAYIGANVEIGKNCYIGPNSSIMDGSILGDNVIVNANVVISFSIIGNNCEFLNGAKIGQDGFGFVHNKGINYKIIQFGIVKIGDNVEIGANTCVDRGAIGNTIISNDVKIDNLCQIAHNVEIGKGTVIAGSTAVAGSCKIGNYVQIGGNCSVGGHIKVGDGSKIAGMSGVMRDVEPMSIVAGIPVMPITKWHRLSVIFDKLINGKIIK